MSERIHLDAPKVGEAEKRMLIEAVESGFVSVVGPLVDRFQERMAAVLGVKQAVSTQSGTASLHMALHELGIGPGDEVIVPAMTFIATVNPVSYVGATPVFVDVTLDEWTIDPSRIEAAITDKTKAIIPVHLYGNSANMDAIIAIARRHNVYVIEDATESLGTSYGGRASGTMGDFGCFSFNGNKMITTGGGGLVVSNNAERLDHIQFLVNQAHDRGKKYFHPEVGFNYRMTNIEAAIGLAQLEQLDSFLQLKKTFATIYEKGLSDLDGVSLQQDQPNSVNARWLTCIRIEREGFDLPGFQTDMLAQGVPTRRVFMPITDFPPYSQHGTREDFPNASTLASEGLTLPSSTLNSLERIREACDMLRSTLNRGSRQTISVSPSESNLQ